MKRGSVLVGLLWCVALLAVVVGTILYSARLELMVVKNQTDSIQAYYLAIAGAEKAKALIYHDAGERQRSQVHHTGSLFNNPGQFRDIELGRGLFRVLRQGSAEEGGGIVHGISDEESRLNLNTAATNELEKLRGMTREVAAAIVDWRDEDSNPLPGGAEAEYYTSLRPPYLPRNANFQTARELLMVRGVTREALLGEDANQNGLLDPEEEDGSESYPPDNRDRVLDHGWAGYLSFETVTRNITAGGQARIDVQAASENELSAIPGFNAEIARAIVAHRGQSRIENLADLLEVSAASDQNQNQQSPGASPGPARPQSGGPSMIDEDLLLQVADEVKAGGDDAGRGLVNINTASPEVLECLPEVTEQIARAIVLYRGSSGYFPNVAHLLRVQGMTREIFRQVAPRVTVRSDNFRILSEGTVPSTGARKRIETIVRLTSSGIETISYRENL